MRCTISFASPRERERKRMEKVKEMKEILRLGIVALFVYQQYSKHISEGFEVTLSRI